MKNFLVLMRLRTLPLGFSVILCGSALAVQKGVFDFLIFILILITCLSLQSLSNMANDYGDGIRGTDKIRNKNAPKRIVGDNLNELKKFRFYLFLMLSLAVIFGLILLTVATKSLEQFLLFIFLGLLAILAALTYTIGKYAYAYHGLGDLSVMLFFGYLGVLGSYFLYGGNFNYLLLLPASAMGFLSVGVLNINNIRDIESDKISNKNTTAVRLGLQRAKIYQIILVSLAFISYLIYSFNNPKSLLFILVSPLIYKHLKRVYQGKTCEIVGKELKAIVKISLFLNLLFFLGFAI